MKKEDVLKKVQDLLELANNEAASEGEAKAAMLAAQRLIAKHEIKDSELIGDKKAKIVAMEVETYRNFNYRDGLAQIISKNFRCRVFTRRRNKTRVFCFLGYEEDVKVAVEVFNYAYKVIHSLGGREYRRVGKAGKSTDGVFISYTNGFLVGLKAELDAQCKALMIVVPNEVNKELDARTVKGKGQKTKAASFNESWAKGVEEGREFMKEKKSLKAEK